MHISHLHNNPGMSSALRNCLSPEPQERAVALDLTSPLQINHIWTGEIFSLVALFTRGLCPHNFNGIALIGFKKVKSEIYLDVFLKVNSREVKEVKRIRDISSKLQLLGWPRKFFGFSPEVLQKTMKKLFQLTQEFFGNDKEWSTACAVSLISFCYRASQLMCDSGDKLHVWMCRVLYLYLFT